ncbi:ADP-ribosyl-[dinitrogen reductase] hydrolase [Dysgonomonas sp. PFB1-18]|uniref:ADP-ribosylglycohydrolase family protein n=1 Tax=unclassified Dysgonomonas TaxID=2630389 RepID=UPI0024736295|nr:MULTISPECIES: ADP-ribosylglycohydrolase family protein [unclassified Dysgonomonas]MDH6308924.1 ADP-ribosyl-[dinitrogen reductase] hydrolase [Dysgonomonas sp. PF1-14]MDH6338675.1 ADP-ribosyl-[dinitrogen reductase] hydrolase [Dysgonomonas sp. PF1-16]MDH6380297.1 ADP-ribosyl-[dinitrogen reductase] hydrolase [Dysgonomonas sp. PFB1-18]MDH6397627.1 ADP-ribosyl-[dinitrogen reductase] hydrolase [Dysgonomonas sp. PF1-23]
MKDNVIHSALFGVAVGDALGVPVEFKDRSYLKKNPVVDYLGYMCWNQPPGTWSDDSSLTFCLAESLCKGYDLDDIATNFVKWYQTGYWGAHYKVFDIGGSTRYSIQRLIKGESPRYSGNMMESDNGNGSLMRILPIAFYLAEESDLDKIYKTVKEISSITHAHFRSVFACFIYIIFVLEILKNVEKRAAYKNMQNKVLSYIDGKGFNEKEVSLFERLLNNDIEKYKEDEIASSGYVLHSLEAAFWCLMNEDSYHKTVLKAVNLGGDTDTTAAIAGGLAGLLYGFDAIPQKWIDQLARKGDIMELCDRLGKKCNNMK